MTYQEIAELIDGIGLPNAYYQFADQTGQEPPFICFYYPESDDFHADNGNYQAIRRLIIELYTDNKDFINEGKIEAALGASGIPWHKEETYIDEEKMYMVAYDTEVLIHE